MVVGRRSIEQLRDRAAECLIESPRSPCGELLEVGHELDGDRLVEARSVVEGVAGRVGGALAEDGPARVARDEPREDEHEEDDPEQDRDA